MRNLSNYKIDELISEYLKDKIHIHSDYYSFGSEFLLKKEKRYAKEDLIQSAKYITENNFYHVDKGYILFGVDRITSAFSLQILLTEFDLIDIENLMNALVLTYLELSKWLKINPDDYDSYRSRALILIKNRKNLPTELLFNDREFGGIPGCLNLVLFTDLYIAATLPNTEHKNLMKKANQIYDVMLNKRINGRYVHEMSLQELSIEGMKFHEILFENFNKNYSLGEYKISEEDLERIVLLEPKNDGIDRIFDF